MPSGVQRVSAEGVRKTSAAAHTFLNIVQLAWPGMAVEIDVIAVVPEHRSTQARS